MEGERTCELDSMGFRGELKTDGTNHVGVLLGESGDLVSILMTPMAHIITPVSPIF